jgi:hypothetical protein
MTVATHPGSSLETLSRRHDGELSPAEREAFERHLAGCAECREATAAFERSLAAFRTAPEAPVPSDLSARILRKIRSQTPSRCPFGVLFGIDIRWAGVFLAALLVATAAVPGIAATGSCPRRGRLLTAYVVTTRQKQTRDAAEKRELQGAKGDARGRKRRSRKPVRSPKTAESAGQTKPADSPPEAARTAGCCAQPPARLPPGEAGAAVRRDPSPEAPAGGCPQRRSDASPAAPGRWRRRPKQQSGFVSRERRRPARSDRRGARCRGAAPDVAQTRAAGRPTPP